MQHESVQKLFKEQVKRYSKKEQAIDSQIIPLVLNWLKRTKTNRKIEICEFGGGAGQLLAVIQEKYPRVSLTNAEIIDEYKPFLVSKKIRYITRSILDSRFPNDSFDIVIMRDVLHHLIGDSYKETLENQRKALEELRRLVRPQGAIFIEELTNESHIATKIIYFLTKFNSKIGVRIPALFISPNVIVAFLTSRKLFGLIDRVFGRKNVEKKIMKIDTKWYFKLVNLLGNQKKIAIVIKKY